MRKLEINGKDFLLDGKKFNIYSGAIHYFRVLPEQWEDRLTKLKLAGFNTVETYVSWNLHEPKKGEFCFDGMLDIAKFIKTAEKVGLYVIVRPGPYICAEWDFGGFPAWLLADDNIRLRCMNDLYLGHVSDFYKQLLSRIVDLQITKGGNIISMQVENEYGSYANDHEYLDYIKNLMIDCGVDVLLFTSDGNWKNMISGGSNPDLYKVLNFGSGAKGAFNALKPFAENGPNMCGEFWCGWFDHWSERHHVRMSGNIIREMKNFLEMDASFNFYMFFGGTNFNFWAGANGGTDFYQPTTTSYDYSAPLTEWGGYTKTYHALREALLAHQGLEALPLPKETPTQNIGKINFDQFATLEDNMAAISTRHHCGYPARMEKLGQNFGMMKYTTVIKGHYAAQFLTISDIHDIAYVYIDGVFKAKFDRSDMKKGIFKKSKSNKIKFLAPSINGEMKIEILVDALGRVNYGSEIYDKKGIGPVSYGNQQIFGWDIDCIPLDNIDKLTYKKEKPNKFPCFMKANFKAELGKDCFVDMTGFEKGCVYVNGFNLGRFWSKGPQKALYLPYPILREENEIVVFEHEGCKETAVDIIDKPKLGKIQYC